jgi:hypothetical protein
LSNASIREAYNKRMRKIIYYIENPDLAINTDHEIESMLADLNAGKEEMGRLMIQKHQKELDAQRKRQKELDEHKRQKKLEKERMDQEASQEFDDWLQGDNRNSTQNRNGGSNN